MTAGTGRSITRGRVRGASVALATMLLAGVAALAPSAAAVPALTDAGAVASAHAATDATALQVRVEVNQISPQVLAPGQDLTVTATLTNTGTTALTQPRVLVHLARAGFISRSSLDRWRKAGTTGDLGVTVLTVDLTTPLAPGGTATVVATVPAGSVGLRTAATAWGPRGLALEVVDAADPARIRLGLVRTFTLWFPDQEVTPTQVSVLVPLVGGVPDDDAAATLEALTRTGGRLARVLDATAEHTSVSWAVDPALVEQSAASDAQEDDASQGTDGPGPATQAWGSALRTAVTGREVVLLPWGDADVTALAHARATEVLDQALARSRDVASSLGLPGAATDVITWPAEQLPDLATAAFMTSDASRAVVVGPGELDAPAALTYTPSGRATVGASGRDVTVLIPDERLSTALTTGVVASAEDADAADMSQVTGATAAADLLAELAVITRERPNQSRGMLLTVPRTWAPDPAIAAAQLAALESAP
ncbi:MAG: hypothetical protein HGA44_11600, partial [Cellulomonadaceae bacterium]|nr:hypothetical protein [Cellulomonadaceae bacterium]